jgi:hypothetical protein
MAQNSRGGGGFIKDHDMTKDELLWAIGAERADLEAVLAPLTDAQLEAPGPNGGWGVKGHLAHIAAWEHMIVAHLTDRSAHTYAWMTAEQYVSASLDELNARLHELHADDALADVKREFAVAHAAIVAFLEAMPESRLSELYWGDDAAQRTVLEKVSGDTYLHYREHAAWIRELIAARTTA